MSSLNQLELKLEELREKSIGTNTRYLTLKILGGIDFLVPDVAEQDKWMAFVRQSDKSKFTVSNRNLSRCSDCQTKMCMGMRSLI